jgi:hypothetical protein
MELGIIEKLIFFRIKWYNRFGDLFDSVRKKLQLN